MFGKAAKNNYLRLKFETGMEAAFSYLEQHRERFLDELLALLRIPSISAEQAHIPDMIRCAEWLRIALQKAGLDRAEVMPTAGNPVVYGEKIIDPEGPTLLIYGHYDVMPVDPREAWNSDPFEPEIRNGRIWARGANDDKGQSYMHIKAAEALIRTGTLPCNLKFMIEGEEEIGSSSLERWCAEHAEMLKADLIVVSDTSLLGWETPSITCGLRGLCYLEMEVTGPNQDLHSGLYGGAVANPANVLARLIASLTDAQGRITIPGFYDRVRELSPEEREAFARAPFSESVYKEKIGIRATEGETGYSTLERTGIRPSLDVNGIWGGYTGEGSKTVIPSKACAKISMRLVPDQDYRQIAELFERHIRSLAPDSVSVAIKTLHGGMPYVCPTDLPAYRAAASAMRQTFGCDPLPFYSGGSIPIISTFEKVLGIKSLLMGFGLGEDAIHSPNESYALQNFYRGIETILLFYGHYAETLKSDPI